MEGFEGRKREGGIVAIIMLQSQKIIFKSTCFMNSKIFYFFIPYSLPYKT